MSQVSICIAMNNKKVQQNKMDTTAQLVKAMEY